MGLITSWVLGWCDHPTGRISKDPQGATREITMAKLVAGDLNRVRQQLGKMAMEERMDMARAAAAPPMAQERALSAADWHRRGVQAMGLAASQGVVHWVVVAGLPLTEYDVVRRWRRHTAVGQLIAALERLADAYGCA